MAISNIVRLALTGALLVCSIIVLGLSAKLVHDGKIWNDYLKNLSRASFDYSDLFDDDYFNSGLHSASVGRLAQHVKRDYLIGSFIYFEAPVAAYALDLAVAVITIIVGVGAIVLSFISAGLSLLISTVVFGVLALLWLVAMAYSAHAFRRAGQFLGGSDIFPIPKADFAFVVLAWLFAVSLFVLSIILFVQGRKGEAAPEPPVAETAPAAPVYGNDATATAGNTAHPEGGYYGAPAQPNEKPQQTPMNVPV